MGARSSPSTARAARHAGVETQRCPNAIPGSGNCSGMWSSWCHSLYAWCSPGSVISVNEKNPTFTLLPLTTPTSAPGRLLDRDGIDRRAGAADDRLGRRLEQELVDAVVGAV